MQVPGEHIETIHNPRRYTYAQIDRACAMGHGCSVGDHPQHRAVREKAAHLRARIAEHTPSPSER
jgi:hypothetical protein